MAGSTRPRTRVTVVQFATALLMFVVLSVLGGVLVAGLVLPAASVASNAANESSELFEKLPDSLVPKDLPQQTNIYDRSGKHLLATFYSQNRVVVPLEKISPWIQKAVIAVEDKRFWDHNGVDGQGIIRAVYINATSSKNPGGSTLTQQLIKNILLQNALQEDDPEVKKKQTEAATEVSLTRKIREWRLALSYEDTVNNQYGTTCIPEDPKVDCGKEQVLEQYLNIAQFGANIYGVEAASEVYFGKHATQLDAMQAATIAGITQNPSRWDPIRHPLAAQKRRNVVLLTMYQQDMISEADFKLWRATPIANTLDPHEPKFSCAAATVAPFFCDYVTKIINKDPAFNNDKISGKELLKQGGLTIKTTLDYTKQKIANQELTKSMKSTDKSGWAMALVALKPTTGEILAMAQNRTYDPTGKAKGSTSINYSVDRQWGGSRGFSPGSTYKPIVLAAWLESGRSLMQVINASQREYDPKSWNASCLKGKQATYDKWKPGNSEGEGAGQMSVLSATTHSINTGFVAMANEIDLCAIRDTGAAMGFHRADGAKFEVIPSAVLGTQNASPMTMASVAQTIANKGKRCEPIAILSVTSVDGTKYAVPPKDCSVKAIPADVAAGVTFALADVVKEGTGTTAQLAGGRPAAGKTGTAQNSTHLWFMGFTPQLVATVWMGNPKHDVKGENIRINGKPYDILFGSTITAPTWKHFMDRALKGQKIMQFPEVSNDIMYGVPREIPSVVGMTEAKAKKTINEAGFKFSRAEQHIFDPNYVKGTVVGQSPGAKSKALPGSTVTYVVGTDKYPKWWYHWPSQWDQNTVPADYWGDVWPPPEFATNPPDGWETDPQVDPSPGPGDGKGGPGGGGGGDH